MLAAQVRVIIDIRSLTEHRRFSAAVPPTRCSVHTCSLVHVSNGMMHCCTQALGWRQRTQQAISLSSREVTDTATVEVKPMALVLVRLVAMAVDELQPVRRQGPTASLEQGEAGAAAIRMLLPIL